MFNLGKDVKELSSLNILSLGKKVFGKDFFLRALHNYSKQLYVEQMQTTSSSGTACNTRKICSAVIYSIQ